MKKRHNRIKLIRFLIFFLLGVFAASGVRGETGKDKRSTPIKLKIEMKKSEFSVREPVEGRIMVENNYPAALPAIFDIKLFHNENMYSEFLTSVKPVLPGKTVFTFREFGIPQFNTGEKAKGHWQIIITQKDVESGSQVDIYVDDDN